MDLSVDRAELGDGLDEFEELGGVDDRVRHARDADQFLLRGLRAEIP
jgi:hypothetical protein